MSNQIVYENLALEWNPINKTDHRFIVIVLLSLLIVSGIGLILSSIDIPVEDRKATTVIPERIANLVLEQEKRKPIVIPIEKPKPKPKLEPKPVEKTQPRIKKKPENSKKKKPLTKTQKAARERAQESGLLALSNELADLMETPVISMVATKLSNKTPSATRSSSIDKTLLNKGINKGSAGVNSEKYTGVVTSRTSLSTQDIAAINQNLIAAPEQEADSTRENQRVSGNFRAEEEITLVFDQNKSKLYSIYNRARRKSPGLKGKIILEITIAPAGYVISVKILSSELNMPKLEKSFLSRIKLFKFSSGKKEPITVIYPIEFLPS